VGIGFCFRTLIANNQRDYFELARVLNNHINIVGYLYQYGHRDKVPALLQWIAANTRDNPPQTILRNAVIRSGYISHLYTINIDLEFHRSTRGYMFPNLYFCDRSVFDQMVQDYEATLRQVKDPSERDFLLAMNNKRKAMFYYKYWWDRKMKIDELKLDGWLGEAVNLYRSIDTAYLDSKQSSTLIYNGDGVRTSDVKRKSLFIYPDYRDGWFSWTYHSDYFFNYLAKNNLLPVLYTTGADVQVLHYWIVKAFEWKIALPPQTYSNDYPLPDATLVKVIKFAKDHPEGKSFDQNLPLMVLANHAFERGDTVAAMNYYHALDVQNILRSLNRYEYLEKTFFLNMLNQLAVNLAVTGNRKDAEIIVAKFATNRNLVQGYLSLAEAIFRKDADPYTFVLLDSAYAISRKINYAVEVPEIDPRYFQILLLSEIGSRDLNDQAGVLLRDLPETWKFWGVLLRTTGLAYEGNFYMALTAIPNTLTESQDLQCRTAILVEACKAKERLAGKTAWKQMDTYRDWFINYNEYYPN
jgi:hypothetical protein